MDDMVLTPTECVGLINQTLEIAYPTVVVEGEVGSFKTNRDKYVFFDLKDDGVTLNCFMMLWQLKTPLEDGMRVKVLAEPRLTRWGKFSLTIRQVVPVGEGSIKRAFELLKNKFAAEGLLDEARKRPLPRFPARIGVIGSIESAGYADFIKIFSARWGGVTIDVIDVPVQGLQAIEQNISAIEYFQQQQFPVEVLVIIRGGGSADDLAAYNDEQLARTIAASRIPTVVGVGHEVDTSLADLIADVRAATPSNAAQIVVPDRSEVLGGVQALREALQREVAQTIRHRQQLVLQHMRSVVSRMDTRGQKLQIQQLRQDLLRQQDTFLRVHQQTASALHRTLEQLDPAVVLRRGYGVVRKENSVVTTGQQLQKGDMMHIELSDAIVKSEVKNVQYKVEK